MFMGYCFPHLVGKSFKQGGQVALGEISDTILAQVNDFRPQIPLIMALRNPGMQQRHWEEISSRIGFDVFPGTTIQSLQVGYTCLFVYVGSAKGGCYMSVHVVSLHTRRFR